MRHVLLEDLELRAPLLVISRHVVQLLDDGVGKVMFLGAFEDEIVRLGMVIATMAISAFFALFFLRALMMLFRPRFVFGANRDVLFGQVAAATGGGR